MHCYTIQLAKWRKCPQEVNLVDITQKSGVKELAPDWKYVNAIKSGSISEEEFTSAYHCKMQNSYKNNRELWHSLVKNESIALACYCSADAFCHRYLLKGFLKQVCDHLGIEFVDKGEII